MFRIILFFMGFGVKVIYAVAAVLDSDFRKRLGERNMTIVIKTSDGKKARQFQLREGNIFTYGKDHPDPDILIAVSTPLTVYLMFIIPTPRRVVKSFFKALTANKIKIEFKIEPSIWFLTTLYMLGNAFFNRSKA